MAGSHSVDETSKQYELFREALSEALVEKILKPSTSKTKRRAGRSSRRRSVAIASAENPSEEPDTENLAEELTEFIEYIAAETFASLPAELQNLEHHIWAASPSLQERYAVPLRADFVASEIVPTLEPSVADSLTAYGIIPDADSAPSLFAPVLSSYITAASTAPPPPSSTREDATECEICGRDWISLTYHHLIPRAVHAKVLKRGWHRADELQNVAWLCAACHRFVHRLADNETLAREYFTVERLLEREEVRTWAAWAGRLRWKGR